MERAFIAWLKRRLPRHVGMSLAFDDDAALLDLAAGRRGVVSVDMLTEGVDFQAASDAAERVGRKALAVNLSDLAAMAARPVAAVVALALPRSGSCELAHRLYEGMIPLAEEFEIPIVGGDTNTWDGPLAISVTVLGETAESGPLRRSGARPGDSILVTGRFGGSRLGHQFDFTPRVREALWLAEHASLNAGIDASDGLSLDLDRLARASRVAAVIEPQLVPVADAAGAWAARLADGSTPLDHALADGEDFELILAVPPETAARLVDEQPLACGLTRIGAFEAGSGLWQVDESGARTPLAPRGYEH